MEMRRLVIYYLLLDTLVVAIIGVTSIHGEHGWDFFLVNAARLGIMGVIVVLWRVGGSRRLERILFGKRPTPDQGSGVGPGQAIKEAGYGNHNRE